MYKTSNLPNTRIDVADALRGIAVAGIILYQSVIGCFIFCGYGLACYHLLGITYAVMVGCGMVVCQYLFARYWFSNHSRGPLENLWRKLTWI